MTLEEPLYRNITEVAKLVNEPAHVLRFWETKFSQIRPMKHAGGRRYYRPSDIEVIRRIQRLLREEGLTIPGAQRRLRKRKKHLAAPFVGASTESFASDSSAGSAAGAGAQALPLPGTPMDEEGLLALLERLQKARKALGSFPGAP